MLRRQYVPLQRFYEDGLFSGIFVLNQHYKSIQEDSAHVQRVVDRLRTSAAKDVLAKAIREAKEKDDLKQLFVRKLVVSGL
jgi:hypothetical protein